VTRARRPGRFTNRALDGIIDCVKSLAQIPHCTACAARTRGIFSSLTGAQLLKLDRTKTAHEYARGQVIFYEGNPPLAVYCVSSGAVKLYKTGKGDSKVVIRLLGPGETLGFRAVIANEPYAATAEAVDRTIVCAIPREVFEDLLRNDSETAFRLISKLAAELRISEDELVSRAQLSVPQRVARFLVWSLENLPNPQKEANRLALPLLREEIAQMIGTTPETLSRIFRDFASRKILKVEKRSILVSNPRALRRLIEE
jgi:CRP-like cAMP-binding protein